MLYLPFKSLLESNPDNRVMQWLIASRMKCLHSLSHLLSISLRLSILFSIAWVYAVWWVIFLISLTLAPRYRYQHLYVSILTGSALEIAITCVARVTMLSDQKFIQRYGHGQNSDFFGKDISIAMSCLNILQICWRTRWFCSQSELKGNQQYIHLIEPPSISCPISGAYSDWNWEDVP